MISQRKKSKKKREEKEEGEENKEGEVNPLVSSRKKVRKKLKSAPPPPPPPPPPKDKESSSSSQADAAPKDEAAAPPPPPAAEEKKPASGSESKEDEAMNQFQKHNEDRRRYQPLPKNAPQVMNFQQDYGDVMRNLRLAVPGATPHLQNMLARAIQQGKQGGGRVHLVTKPQQNVMLSRSRNMTTGREKMSSKRMGDPQIPEPQAASVPIPLPPMPGDPPPPPAEKSPPKSKKAKKRSRKSPEKSPPQEEDKSPVEKEEEEEEKPKEESPEKEEEDKKKSSSSTDSSTDKKPQPVVVEKKEPPKATANLVRSTREVVRSSRQDMRSSRPGAEPKIPAPVPEPPVEAPVVLYTPEEKEIALLAEVPKEDVTYQGLPLLVEGEQPGCILKCRSLLAIIFKEHCAADVNRTPAEHTAVEQCLMYAMEIVRAMKHGHLTHVLIREGVENLFDYMEMMTNRNDSTTAAVAANILKKVLTALETAATLCERLSQAKVTNWAKVKDMVIKLAVGFDKPRPTHTSPRIRHFTLNRLLGAGGFGCVYKAFLGGAVCTIKFVPESKMEKKPEWACVDKLVGALCNFKFLVSYFGCFSTNQAFVTCMEYIGGVDVYYVLRKNMVLPELINKLIIAQLGLALMYLHYQGFMHRDVKPANMMIFPGCRVKVIDFDTAKLCIGRFSGKDYRSFSWRTVVEIYDCEVAGTILYLPPECIACSAYGRTLDWWAVGVTTFQLATGQLPFRAPKEEVLKTKILSGKYMWPFGKHSPEIKDFVSRLLRPRADERLCSSNYNDFKNHTWIKQVDVDSLMKKDVYYPDYPGVTKFMVKRNQGYSPIASPRAEQRKNDLFAHPFVDDDSQQVNLYTLASPGFQKAIAAVDKGQAPAEGSLQEPYEELRKEVKYSYRFENLLDN